MGDAPFLTPRVTALSVTVQHAGLEVTVSLTEHGSTSFDGAAELLRTTETLFTGDRLGRERDAFEQGWSALSEQYRLQKHDPTHPITKHNPYDNEGRGARDRRSA